MNNTKNHILRRGTPPPQIPTQSTKIHSAAGKLPPDVVRPCFAAVPRGAEDLAAQELLSLGISDVQSGKGGVSFQADRKSLYLANLWLRTASRVLVQLSVFSCSTPDELYHGVFAIPWHELITVSMTLAVDCSLRDSAMTHSGFVALKTKDAIVDRIRKECSARPNVDTKSPDVRINIHLHKNVCTVSLDSSGEPLDRRGYRLERNEAPLRETLAAAVVALTGWDGETPLADPMCGSGTVPIEAALLAGNVAPGLHRDFGFQRWLDYDKVLWEQLVSEAEAKQKKLPIGLVIGLDQDSRALKIAARNSAKAGFEGQLHFFHAELESFQPEGEKGVVIINPPYGKRLGDEDDLRELYCRIGDILKKRCRGWTGYVLTGNLELAKYIGLKASRRFVLFNGAIECRLLKYELY